MSEVTYPEWLDWFYGDLVRPRRDICGFRPSFRDFDKITQFWEYAPDTLKARLCLALYEMPYDRFLRTGYWHAVKARVIHDRGHRCSRCRKGGEVDVHHLIYENHGREHLFLDELAVLCRDCHKKTHTLPKDLQELIFMVGKGKRL